LSALKSITKVTKCITLFVPYIYIKGTAKFYSLRTTTCWLDTWHERHEAHNSTM